MAKRSLLLATVFASVFATASLLSAQTFGPIGRGGVVGGDTPTTKPATAASAAAPKPALVLPPPITIPSPSAIPADPDDPIERPEFQKKPHAISKNITSATAMMIQQGPDGSEYGVVSAVNAAVAAGTRTTGEGKAVFITKQAKVGPEMQTSFDEAVRAVQVRYPTWEPGRIDFSFDDKYTPHEGGSAGTCFATLLLSELEGFNVDLKCAITGDITVNWKVKQIGGLPAKLRGAVAGGCQYAGVPLENVNDLSDMALIYGESSLRDIQVFSLESLQDAVHLMRTDRPARLAAAIKAFDDLKPRMKAGKPALEDKLTQKSLEEILALAPNHQSARLLLDIGRGNAPRNLTVTYSLEQIFIITYPYRYIITGREPATSVTVTSQMTTNARKQLSQLAPITPPELQALLTDARAVIETSSVAAANANRQTQTVLDQKCDSFLSHYAALKNDRALVEKLYRGK
ncbi:MAG TPA: S16 family serine protease [Phycisphaerae bacterium]|jgi:hypothetical protein|nr:S16 family serine protease [Phycisphaerae bacterium]